MMTSKYYLRTNEGAYLQGHANPTPLWTNKKADAEKLEYGEAVYFADKIKNTLRKNVSIHLEQTTNDIEEVKRPADDSLFLPLETDDINHPEHYTQYSFEAIDIIDEVAPKYPIEVAMEIGNAIKYLLRAPFKGRLIQDLNKANWYISRAIDNLEKSEKYDYED